jgi:hypothetical protein
MAVGTFITPLVNDWTKPDDWIDISNVGNNEINLLVTDSSVMGFYVYTSSGTYSIDWGDGTVETGRTSGTFYQHTFATGAGTSTSYGYNTIKIRIYGASGNIIQYQGYRPSTPSTLGNWASGSPLLWAVFGTNNLTSLQSAFGDASSLYPTILQSVTLPSIISGITGNGFGTTFANAFSLRSVVGLNSPWGNVTSLQNMFVACSSLERINLPNTLPSTITSLQGTFQNCSSLRTINFPSSLPTSLTGTGLDSTFSGCGSLRSINITSWPNALTSLSATFSGCNNLTTVTLPSNFPTSLTTTANMFNACRSLQTVTLPTAWPTGLTTTTQMFINCYGLTKVVLPSTGSNNLVTCSTMFQTCYNLRDVQNTSTLGSTTTATTLAAFLTQGGGAYITGSLSFGANLSAITVNGSATTQMASISGVRLTNTGSAFGGTSPQVNVQYCMMETGSLVNLFNDLTTVTGKTINITGCNGAASLTAGQRLIATNKGWTITG